MLDKKLPKLNPRHRHLPEELQGYILDGSPVSYAVYLKFKDIYSSKRLKVQYECVECGKSHVSDFKHLNKRARITDAYCPSCVMSAVGAMEGWRKANSDAQLKVQGTPEARRKNSQAVSKFWKDNPDRLETMRQRVLSAQSRPDVIEKYLRRNGHNGRGISGLYQSKWGELAFDSSYELAYLVSLEDRNDVISVKRGPVISYNFEGVQRSYLVDFEVFWTDGSRSWVEVKSGYVGLKVDRIEKLKAKLKAAIEASRQFRPCSVEVITEKNSLERCGFKMPRGTWRIKLLKDNAPKITWSDPSHKEKYG